MITSGRSIHIEALYYADSWLLPVIGVVIKFHFSIHYPWCTSSEYSPHGVAGWEHMNSQLNEFQEKLRLKEGDCRKLNFGGP